MRPRVYIAGPISQGDLHHNINQARDAAKVLIRLGFAPLVPQLTCFLASDTPCQFAGFDHDTWMDVDLPWVSASDAILRLPGASRGADLEVQHAQDCGVPVFLDTHSLARWFRDSPRHAKQIPA